MFGMDNRIVCGFITFIILVLVYLHRQQDSSSTGIGPKPVTAYECVKESIVGERVKLTDAQDPNKTISMTYTGSKKNAVETMQKASQLTGEIIEKEALEAREKLENDLNNDAEGRRQEVFQDQVQHASIIPEAFKAKSVEKVQIPVAAAITKPVHDEESPAPDQAKAKAVTSKKPEVKIAICSTSSSEDEQNLLWMMPRQRTNCSGSGEHDGEGPSEKKGYQKAVEKKRGFPGRTGEEQQERQPQQRR